MFHPAEAFVRTNLDFAARRLAYWVPLLAQFFWLQSSAQLLTVMAGVLVVRALRLDEFAVYTIALAAQTTVVILSDGGLTQALLARAGAVATDRARFSQAVQTALALRRRLGIATLAVGVPVLLVLLRWYDVSWTACALASAAVAVSLHASVKQTIFATVLFLQFEPARVQRAAAIAAFVRLAATLAAVALFSHWLVFLWIGSAAVWVQALLTRRAALTKVETGSAVSPDDRAAMLLAFRNQLLNGIYFALQPQITVWILTVFGTAARVAEIGALGRLAIVFAVLSSAFSALVLPRFSRYTDAGQVQRRYVLFTALSGTIGAAVVLLAWAFPRPLLMVLGPQYMHLEAEVVWVIGAAAVSLLCSAVYLLNTARNWVRGLWLGVPATLIAQVAVASYADLSTIRGALLIQVSAFAAPFLVNVAIGIRGIRETRRQAVAVQPPHATNV
jgi:O-antigen/teichoic acid export membrane protein